MSSRAIGRSVAAAFLAACGPSTPVPDRLDAALAWPSHQTPLPRPDAGLAFVTDNTSGDLALLDLAGPTTIGRARIGIDPLGNDGPHRIRFDATAGRLFVTLNFPPSEDAPGPHSGHGGVPPGYVLSLARDDLHEIARREIEPYPGDLALTPDRRSVLVTHYDIETTFTASISDAGAPVPATFWILDATTLARVAAFPLCISPYGIAVDPTGRTAYVACYGEETLAIISLDDPMHPFVRTPVGPSPGQIPMLHYGPVAPLATADGRFVVVSDADGEDLRVFDVGAARFDDTRAIALHHRAGFGIQSRDGAYLFIAAQGPSAIVRLRAADVTLDTIGEIGDATCPAAIDVVEGPDGTLYEVCQGDGVSPGAVVAIDRDTLTVRGVAAVGAYPDAIAIAPND